MLPARGTGYLSTVLHQSPCIKYESLGAHFLTFARHARSWNCIGIHMQVHHTTKRQFALVVGVVYVTGPDLVNVTVAFTGRHPT